MTDDIVQGGFYDLLPYQMLNLTRLLQVSHFYSAPGMEISVNLFTDPISNIIGLDSHLYSYAAYFFVCLHFVLCHFSDLASVFFFFRILKINHSLYIFFSAKPSYPG